VHTRTRTQAYIITYTKSETKYPVRQRNSTPFETKQLYTNKAPDPTSETINTMKNNHILPVFYDETDSILKQEVELTQVVDVEEMGRSRGLCNTRMVCIKLLWNIISEFWLLVLITMMCLVIYDGIFHAVSHERMHSIHDGAHHYFGTPLLP